MDRLVRFTSYKYLGYLLAGAISLWRWGWGHSSKEGKDPSKGTIVPFKVRKFQEIWKSVWTPGKCDPLDSRLKQAGT